MRYWKGWDAVKLLDPSKHTPSWCETKGHWAKIVTTRDSKAGVWPWLDMKDSNLNLAQPFIILTMRHWKGWDAVNCPNLSKATQWWRQKQNTCQANFTPNHDSRHIVMIILEPIYQSQPCATIHCTYNEILGGLRYCELPKSVQTHWILVSKVESR